MRFVKSLFFVCACLLACTLFCGCSSVFFPEPAVQVTSYDIVPPEKPLELPVPVIVSSFENVGINRFKMVYRSNSTTMNVADRARWVQSPAATVRRYLSLAFSARPKDIKQSPVIISGSVLCMEAELEKNTANLFVQFRLAFQGKQRVYPPVMIRKKMDELSASCFSKTISLSLADLALVIQKDIKDFVAE